MRIAQQRSTNRDRMDASITPLINIVFLLLLFFIVVGSLSTMELRGTLPESNTERLADIQGDVLVMNANGMIFWKNRQVTLGELEESFQQSASGPDRIVLQADREVTTGHLIPLLETLQRQGIASRIMVTAAAGSPNG